MCRKQSPETIVLQFTRVVFGGPFSFERHHSTSGEALSNSLVGKLLKSTYVNDIITGAKSQGAAYQLYSTGHSHLGKHVHMICEWHGVHVRGMYATPMCWRVVLVYVHGRAYSKLRVRARVPVPVPVRVCTCVCTQHTCETYTYKVQLRTCDKVKTHPPYQIVP